MIASGTSNTTTRASSYRGSQALPEQQGVRMAAEAQDPYVAEQLPRPQPLENWSCIKQQLNAYKERPSNLGEL